MFVGIWISHPPTGLDEMSSTRSDFCMRTFHHRNFSVMPSLHPSSFLIISLILSNLFSSVLFLDGKIIGWKGVENVDILAFELAPNIQVGLCLLISSKSELDNRISWNAEWCYAVAWYAALHCYLSSQFMFYVFSYHYFDTDAQSSMEQTYTRMAGEVHVLTHRPVTHGHLLHFGFLARLISRFFSLFHVDPAYD